MNRTAPRLDPALAERYGHGRRPPWPLFAIVGLFVVAGVAWLVWATSAHGRPEVTSQLDGFDVRDQHEVTATYTVVRRSADVEASCVLRALAADHAVVGELSVPVRTGPKVRKVRSTVRTERAATTVDLLGCSSEGQGARR